MRPVSRRSLLAACPFVLVMAQPDLGTCDDLSSDHGRRCLAMNELERQSWSRVLAAIGGDRAARLELRAARLPEGARHELLEPGGGSHRHRLARAPVADGDRQRQLFGEGFMRARRTSSASSPTSSPTSRSPCSPRTGASSGASVLIVLYAFLTIWAIHVASQAKDRFGAALAIGVGAMIFWHAVLNIGMAVGVCRSSASPCRCSRTAARAS